MCICLYLIYGVSRFVLYIIYIVDTIINDGYIVYLHVCVFGYNTIPYIHLIV